MKKISRKIIGGMLVASPFIATFIFCAKSLGILYASHIFGSVGVVIFVIITGVYLLQD